MELSGSDKGLSFCEQKNFENSQLQQKNYFMEIPEWKFRNVLAVEEEKFVVSRLGKNTLIYLVSNISIVPPFNSLLLEFLRLT